MTTGDIADATRGIRDAIERSRASARRGRLAQAMQILDDAVTAARDSEVDAAVTAEAYGLLAEHAVTIGDDALAEGVIDAALRILRGRSTAESDAHLAPALAFLRASAKAEDRDEPATLAHLPTLGSAIGPDLPLDLLARCLLARGELELDSGDAESAEHDAIAAGSLLDPTAEVDLAIVGRLQMQARSELGDPVLAVEHLRSHLEVFVANGLHLEAAQTRHAIAEVVLTGPEPNPFTEAERADAIDDLVATLLFLDTLRLQFDAEAQRVGWAAHVVEPVLALALEVAIRQQDAVLVADLVASARSVGVPTIRPALGARGGLRTPASSTHERGVDSGAVISRSRDSPTVQLARDPSPAPVMPDGRIALDRQRQRSALLFPDR